MAVNKFFHDSNKTSISAERDLYKNLVKEAIQIHGHDVYYVNRTFVNEFKTNYHQRSPGIKEGLF